MWYLLVHQIPPRPLYLRAKVRQRLARVGALSLKNSVYVLPAREDCREDFSWIAQEARAGGGDAFVCRAEFVEGVDADELVRRFQAEASARYQALAGELRRLLKAPAPSPAVRARLRRGEEEARATDFFGAPGGQEVAAMLKRLETRAARTAPARGGTATAALRAGTWVTRRDVHVDRIATAWLVRRFVNARARFRFVDPDRPGAPRPREVRFDMPGAEFTHEGDRCTLETVLARAGLRDAGLSRIAEVVHDLDLKDDKYGRPEAAGVRQLLEGIYARYEADADRLEAGFQVFDHLYASFASARPRRRRRPSPK